MIIFLLDFQYNVLLMHGPLSLGDSWVSCYVDSGTPNPYNEAGPMSIHKKFLHLNKIWYVGRGRWVIRDCILYDLSKVKAGHRCPKVAKMVYFKVYILCWYACYQRQMMNYDTEDNI